MQFLPFVYFAAAVAQGGFELRTLRIRCEIRLLYHGLDVRGGGGEQLGRALTVDGDGQIASAALDKCAQQARQIHCHHHHARGDAAAQHRRHAVEQATPGTIQSAGGALGGQYGRQLGIHQGVGCGHVAEAGQQMLLGVVQTQAFKAMVEAQLFPISLQHEAGFPVDRTVAAGHQKIGQRRACVH
ncbi:MAG: hypothetical protein ABS92_13880 [Thiobacillus sp. SCN 63-374]|nr:MAG: hypothetical protein ABS92_13880 [Thiobacillus sp. SCN 63-374]